MLSDPTEPGSSAPFRMLPLKRPFQYSLRTLLLLALPTAFLALLGRWIYELAVSPMLLIVGAIGFAIGLVQSFVAEVLLFVLRDDRSLACFRGEFVRSTIYASLLIGLVAMLVTTLFFIWLYFVRLGLGF